MSSVITHPLSKSEQLAQIDRETLCPFLLRVFVGVNGHHRIDSFDRAIPSKDEFQMYTWKNATLKELASLIKSVHSAVDRETKFSFKRVVYDRQGPSYILLGTVVLSRKGPDDDLTLLETSFLIGDYLDVAIFPASRSFGGR